MEDFLMKIQRPLRKFYAHIDSTHPPTEQAARQIGVCVENFLAVSGMLKDDKGMAAYDLFDAVTCIQTHLSYDMFGNVSIRSDSKALAAENAFILLGDKFGMMAPLLYFHITHDPLTEPQKVIQRRAIPKKEPLMTFDVEVYGLTQQQESLLLDRILETIKDFGVDTDDVRIFMDDNNGSDCEND